MNDYLFVLLFFIGLVIVGLILSFLGDLFRNLSKPKKQANKKDSKKPTINKPSTNHNLLRSDKELLTLSLDEMSWREFERLCYLYYKAKGYKPRETNEGADGGVDLIIFDKEHKTNVAVQIKHYKKSNRIGVQPIRELNSAKRNHNCILAKFITTSSFTKDALLQADKFNIDTYDRRWVENNVIKWKEEKLKN
ncbi:MAG TPA: restriction endonuclease [Bacilli bacterium]|nr:restriction endonuclease [Bacilli bacterium]